MAKAAKAAGPVPQVRFFPPVELHGRFLALLLRVEKSSDATRLRADFSALAIELTAAGLDFYFLRTLKAAKVGYVIQQSANLGLMGVMQVTAPVIRNILGRLDHAQLQAIARSVRQLVD